MGDVFDCYNLARSAPTGKNLGEPLMPQEGEPLMLLLCAVKQDEAKSSARLSSSRLPFYGVQCLRICALD